MLLTSRQPVFTLALAGLALSLLASSGFAQVPSSALVARARAVEEPPVIDGRLDEWEDRTPEIRLDHRDQIWRGTDGNRETPWSGPEDASAELYFAYDSICLYVAGRVVDDDLVYNETRWWRGDAIELFVDASLRSNVNDSPDVIDLDDSQVFLMPWQDQGRRWGVVTPNGTQSDGQFDGVQIASRRIDANTYEFEAALPWVNFYGFRHADGVIGFHVALDDFDLEDGPDPTYLSWNGEGLLYERVQERGRLELLDTASVLDQASRSRRRTHWWQTALEVLFRVLAAVGVIGALFFLVPSLYRLFQVRRRWRNRTLWIVMGALGACILGTTALIAGRGFEARDRLEDVAETVERLESEGWLELFLGGIGDAGVRSNRVLELLSGREVELPPEYGFELVDLKGGDPDDALEEALPLRPNDEYSFPVHPSGPADRIDLLLSVRLSSEAASRSENALVARAGRLMVELDDGTQLELPTRGRFALRRSMPPFDEDAAVAAGLSVARELGEGRTVDRLSLSLPESHRGREIRRLTVQIQSGSVRSELHGIERVLLDEDGSVQDRLPVTLGSVGRTGIPAAVRGTWPRDPGIVIDGERPSFELPLGRPAAGSAWLILEASGLDQLHLLSSEPVATVSFRYVDDVTKTTFPLHRGRHFVEPNREPGRPYRASESPIAYEWREADGLHQYGIVEIPLRKAPLESMRVELAPSITRPRVRLAALTLGRPQPHRTLPESELVQVEGGRARLQAGMLADPETVRFSVFLDDRLVTSTFEGDLQEDLEGTWASDEEATFAGDAGKSVRLRDLGSEAYFESIVRIAGLNQPGRALGLYVAAEPSAWLERVRNWAVVGMLVLMIPFVILRLSAALSRLRRLRTKLLAAFTLTSLVPVLVSFVVLANLLESNHRKELMTHAEKALEDLHTALDQRERSVQELAEGCLQIIDEELWQPGLELSVFDALPPQDMQRLLQDYLREALGAEAPLPMVAVEENRGLMRREIFFADPAGPPPSPMFEVAEPGIYRRWGRTFLFGSHREGGELLRVAVVLEIDDAELARLVPRDTELPARGLLYSVRGYLAADSDADQTGSELAAVSREVRHSIGEIARRGGPAIRLDLEGLAVLAYDLVQRADGEAVGVLAARLPLEPMRLGLLVAEVPVRDFFLVAGLFAVLVAVTVATVMTDRLTRPLLRLEKGAREVSRGNYRIRVRDEAADEIGQLARTFNFMTASLDDRLRDLSSLHQGMKDLARHLDRDAIIEIAVDFLVERLDPARVQVVLLSRLGEAPQAFEWSRRQPLQERALPGDDEDLLAMLRETTELELADDPAALEELRRRLGKQRRWTQRLSRVIVLPLPLTAPTYGLVLIGFDDGEDEHTPDPNFLATMASQVAVALDNARLYRLAIVDPRTGLYTHAYFESRLAEELDRAAENGRPLSVMKIAIDEASRLERDLGGDRWRSLVLEVLGVLRDTMHRLHLMATSGRGEYEIMLPETAPAAATSLCRAIVEAVRSKIHLPDGQALSISAGAASYPEDGEGKEFLLSSVEQRLMTSQQSDRSTPAGPAEEVSPRTVSRQERLRRIGAVFESPKMVEIFETCERISASNITVLIEGETGVGKEVLAELIHQLGDRAQKPIVRVNCSAFPETLLENELFGHEKGAFTGAVDARIGRFEMAHGGTLFLDEIGEISLATQVKLLRVLQERHFERLGGNETIEADVRVIAATNRDLVQAIRDGDFREDLYYRLRVVSIVVPPLRERKEEIPTLVRLFRDQFNRENPKKPIRSISPRAMDRLFHHDWPGNIRELKNVIQRAMVLAEGDVVQPEHLFLEPGPRQAASERDLAAISRPRASAPRAALPEKPKKAPERSATFAREVSGLNPRQARLLEYLEVAGRITNREYIEREGISERTGLRDITDLVRRHYLEKRGRRKGAYYVIAGADSEVG